MVGVTFCVVEFSYFGLCNVLCREGLRSSAVYLGIFPRGDRLGARARRACAGQTFPPGPLTAAAAWNATDPRSVSRITPDRGCRSDSPVGVEGSRWRV